MDTPEKRNSTAKSVIQRVFSGTLTLAFIALAAVIVWQGSGIIAQRANAVVTPQPTQALTVRTGNIQVQDQYTILRAFAGQIEPPQSVSIAFETGGTVSSVFFDEGESVKKGDVLAKLDSRLLQAELNRLQASRRVIEAQKELAVLTNERQSQLQQKGFASGQTADQSRLSVVELDARLAEIDSSILAAEIRIEKTTVIAPFDGQVDQRNIDPGTAIGSGQSVLSLLEENKTIFRVGIDPDLTDSVAVGSTLNIVLNGESKAAKVIALLPRIDPSTRTRIIRAELLEDVDLAYGQTARLMLPLRIESRGVWVPLSAIEDGVRGLWTVKTIKDLDQPTVSIEAVEVIHADEKRAYVRGTFEDDTLLILDGMHRVVAGQAVNVTIQEN